MKNIIVIIPFFLLAGCVTDKPAAPQVDTTSMTQRMDSLNQRAIEAEAKIVAQNDAQKKLDAASLERLSKLKVNVVLAHGAVNDDNKPVAQGELTVAEARLTDVQPDPQEQIAAAQRKQLVAEGKMQEAQAAYGIAAKDAQDKATAIGVLTTERDVAKADADKARQTADKARLDAKAATDQLAQAVNDAKAQERAQLALDARKAQIHAANWAGGICGLIALACIAGAVFLSAAAPKFIRGAICAGILCLLCFGFARFLSAPWFDTAAKWVGIAIGVAIFAWVAYEIRAAIEDKSAAAKAAKTQLVASVVVDALDAYYDTKASDEAKADMDKSLFPALSEKGAEYTACVKEIQAANVRAAPTTITAK